MPGIMEMTKKIAVNVKTEPNLYFVTYEYPHAVYSAKVASIAMSKHGITVYPDDGSYSLSHEDKCSTHGENWFDTEEEAKQWATAMNRKNKDERIEDLERQIEAIEKEEV